MKKIVLNTPVLDNAGGYCDAGTELEIGAKVEAGKITSARAAELVDTGLAATAAEAAEIEREAQKQD